MSAWRRSVTRSVGFSILQLSWIRLGGTAVVESLMVWWVIVCGISISDLTLLSDLVRVNSCVCVVIVWVLGWWKFIMLLNLG